MRLYCWDEKGFVPTDESRLIERFAPLSCICGCGGKTSLLFYVGRKLASSDSVLLSTSCHLALEKEAALSVSEAKRLASAGQFPVLAGRRGSEGKLEGFSPAEERELFPSFSYVLLECDGSRGLPLKLPREGEPVLPEAWFRQSEAQSRKGGAEKDNTGGKALFLILGLSAIGQKAGDCVHRLGERGVILYPELTADTRIEVSHIAEILKRGYFQKELFRDPSLTLILNQADTEDRLLDAEKLVTLLLENKLLRADQILALHFFPEERHPR